MINEIKVEETKKVDMSKLPVDTLVECRGYQESGEVLRYFASPGRAFDLGATSKITKRTTSWHNMRIVEQPTVTFWGGGECPIPVGIRVELHFRGGGIMVYNIISSVLQPPGWVHTDDNVDIIGHRILGYAEGWE